MGRLLYSPMDMTVGSLNSHVPHDRGHPRHNRGGLEFGLEKKFNSSPSSQQLAWKTEKRRSREFFSVCHFAFEIVVVPVSSVPPIWPSPQFYGIYFKICRRGAPLT